MRNAIFSSLITFSQKHAPVVLITIALITVVMAFAATGIEIDPDALDLLPEDSRYAELQDRYDTRAAEDYLLIAVESDDPFKKQSLASLLTVCRQMEKLDGFINSSHPFNMVTFIKSGKRLELVPAAPDSSLPSNRKESTQMRKRLLSDPFARGLVISGDGKMLISTFVFEKKDDPIAFMEKLENIVSPLSNHYTIYLDGTFPFTKTTFAYLTEDFTKLIGFAALFILLIYFLSFRSLRSVFLPFLVVAAGTLWCVGTMAVLGFPLTLVSIVAPPLVLTIGSSYSIHILNQYYREARSEKTQHKQQWKERNWIADSVAHVNKTVVMAALTTIIGFLSLLSGSIKATRQFGIATSLGIAFCALLSLFFLPAILRYIRPPSSRQHERVLNGPMSRLIGNIGYGVVKYRIPITVLFLAMIIGAIFAYPHIRYQTDFIAYFPKDEKVIKDNEYIKSKIGKYDFVNITLSAPEAESNYFLKPDILESILKMENKMQESERIAYIYSFVSYLAHLNKLMNEEYAIPETRGLILLLSRYIMAVSVHASTEDLLSNISNKDFSELTISFRYREIEGYFQEDIGKSLEVARNAAREYLPDDLKLTYWGFGPRFMHLADIFSADQKRSTVIAMLLVLIVTSIAVCSIFYGLAALIPLICGITVNYLFMALAGIPLDMTTVMVTSIAIGVGIDDAIHFLLRYRSLQAAGERDVYNLVKNSLIITGRPILLTSISIIGGMMVLVTANFLPIVYFGLLVALALFATAFGTLIVMPAVLSIRELLKGYTRETVGIRQYPSEKLIKDDSSNY